MTGSGDGLTRMVSLAEHERAAPAIRRLRSVGGLGGFGLALAVGLAHGAPLAEVLARAIVTGLAAQLAVWALAVFAWKRLLIAEATAVAARRRARAAEGEQA